MEILIAKNISFCSGVKIAEKKIMELREKLDEDIYIFGELIHNKIFNNYLKERRIFISEGKDLKDKIVVIRTHGISPQLEEEIKKTAKEVIDLTCFKVKAVHKIAEEYSKNGYFTIITGDPMHPEVKGIIGYLRDFLVVSKVEELTNVKINNDKILLLSQTTFSLKEFEKISDEIKKRYPNTLIKNTICDSTYNRQREAKEIASKCDSVIVIGDKKSSNTKKLYEIAKENNENVFYVESLEEINKTDFFKKINKKHKIGIISGASTPIFVIDEIIEKIKMEV